MITGNGCRSCARPARWPSERGRTASSRGAGCRRNTARRRARLSSRRGSPCCAGSGKTTTITRRLANQIVSGEFAPHNLLAVTFTRKAAAELKERLARLGVAGVPASTFHAAAKRQVEGLTGREFDILESATRLLFAIRDRLPQQYRQQNVKDWENEIGRAKSNR